MVTTANTIAQDPEKVGNAFTTLSARIRGSKSELEDLGEETDAYVESTSKLRDQVKATTGVDIMKDKNTYKDIYTILVEIGKVWKDLSDIDQAALLEALAGKRQANIMAGLLNNAELLEDVYKTAENSAGSAMREQENYEKSIQYSLDSAKASVQELTNDFLSSDLLKNLVDSGNTLINILDTLVQHPFFTGVLASSGFGVFEFIKNLDFLNTLVGLSQERMLQKWGNYNLVRIGF